MFRMTSSPTGARLLLCRGLAGWLRCRGIVVCVCVLYAIRLRRNDHRKQGRDRGGITGIIAIRLFPGCNAVHGNQHPCEKLLLVAFCPDYKTSYVSLTGSQYRAGSGPQSGRGEGGSR